MGKPTNLDSVWIVDQFSPEVWRARLWAAGVAVLHQLRGNRLLNEEMEKML